MNSEAEAELHRLLQAAARKPPVIELNEVVQCAGVDSLRRAALAHPVAALNAMLVSLVDSHSCGADCDARAGHIEVEAGRLNIQADVYQDQIQQILDELQRQRFRTYLQERLAAVGLPSNYLDHKRGDRQ